VEVVILVINGWDLEKFEPLSDSIAIFKVCDFGFSFELCFPLSVILVMNCGNLVKVFSL
jgi:hypothetical protein